MFAKLGNVRADVIYGRSLVVRRGVDAGVGRVGALAGHGEVAAVQALLDVKVLARSTVQFPENDGRGRLVHAIWFIRDSMEILAINTHIIMAYINHARCII